MTEYEPPKLERIGDVREVTGGQRFSRPDGNSGTTGNRGRGSGR
jgi:hypothetical protein